MDRFGDLDVFAHVVTTKSMSAAGRQLNLSPAVIEELGYAGKRDKGVLVESVAKDSPAGSVGFRAGDVLVEANGVKIGSTEQLAGLASQRASRYRLIIERGGRLIRSQVGR